MKSPSPSRPRPPKRVKLGSSSPSAPPTPKDTIDTDGLEQLEGDHCSICLQHLVDRTVIPTCAHEFCFECILVWTEQSRRCPLCSQRITEYLIHHIRSKFDYQKHYLTPLRTSPTPGRLQSRAHRNDRRERQRRERPWGRRARRDMEERDEADELERAVARRRWVYDHGLYAKHVASNSFTRYRPYPSPAQFSSSQDLITRMTIFLRRELRVWQNLDVEFLTTFTLSLMKSIDIRSEAAVNLLAEFLDMDMRNNGGARTNAEHFAHEVYCYLRSPYRDLSVYDSVVQYDTPADIPPPIELEQSRRWVAGPSSRSRSRSGSQSPRSRSHSRSRSHHHYHSRYHSRSRSRSRLRARSGSRGREEGARRSPPPPARARQQRARDNERRYGGKRDHSPERTGRRASLSRDRDWEERRDKRAPARQRDERRRKDKGKDSRRVDSPIPSRSPSLLSVKDDLANAGPSYTTITEKGKQRADIGCDAASADEQHSAHTCSVVHDRSPHTLAPTDTQKLLDNNLQTTDKAKIDRQTEAEAQPVTSKRKLRPNRNQGILQAVQAHLGSSINPNGPGQQSRARTDGAAVKAKAAEAKDKEDGAAPGNAPDPMSNLGSSVETKSSLLIRLSDRLPMSSGVDSNTFDMQPPATEDLDVKCTTPRLSAPEIMARTRARLAKLKNEPVAGVLPTASEQLDDGHDDRSGEAGAGEHPSQPFSDDDIRTRLLIRLEEEKRQITLPTEVASPHPALSPADTSRNSRAESDSQAAEAKLRMQAQVRVRLAAAKRVTAGHVPDEAPEPRDVQMHGTGQDARKDFGQREESLRATLKERRI